ncbi:MAG TPA: hypothetical protein VMG12_06980 [Polyangiaceae bacterium]|nr:hypothetical protein [Polyangiaceae bacterium]
MLLYRATPILGAALLLSSCGSSAATDGSGAPEETGTSAPPASDVDAPESNPAAPGDPSNPDAPSEESSQPSDSSSAEAPVTCAPELIESQAELDALEGCEVATTGIVIGFEGADLRPLHALRIAAEGLTLGSGSGSVDSLEGLENLERAPLTLGSVLVEDLHSLRSLKSLQSGVEPSFDGGLTITDCPNLKTLAGLELDALGKAPVRILANPLLASLSSLAFPAEAGLVELEANPSLRDLSALHGIEHVDDLQFWDMPQETLDDFAGLRSAGSISLSDNAALVDASGIAQLESVDSLTFQRNPALRTLPPFAQLTRAAGIGFYENPVLERIDSFPVLGSLVGADAAGVDGGTLEIVENASLSVVALSPTLHVANGIRILRNPNLASVELGGLQAIEQALVVVSNPALDVGSAARLEAIPAPFEKIAGNQPGPGLASPCPFVRDRLCDEPPVDNLCAVGTDTVDCNNDGQWIAEHDPGRNE